MNYFFYAVIGIFAAFAFLLFAQKSKKPKAILASGLVIAAIVYIFFALFWGNIYWLSIETLGVFLYSIFYYLGKKYDFRWVGIGWLLHPLWDIVLHLQGAGKLVAPEWYAVACLTFDFVVAGYIFGNTQKSH